MKKLEFETSKGRFLVVDMVIDIWTSEDEKSSALYLEGEVYQVTSCVKLSEITEEQASEIVDCHKSLFGVPLETHIESLHSLLKSKGIHLFDNPYDLNEQLDCNCDMCYQKLEDAFDEAEQKTFYNPYIFKL